MNIFILGTTMNYSENVLASDSSYEVNLEMITQDWRDVFGVTHKIKTNERVVGTFNMQFRRKADYDLFVQRVNQLRTNDTSVYMSVYVNNKNELHSGYFYIDFASALYLKQNGQVDIDVFTVSIEERA